ncbi:MAG: hypothetical protein CTY12_00435 [Methylotenera sp.]|nr:MAG: hypothetical protein CTY12_00435 [Methylotenera sp.]
MKKQKTIKARVPAVYWDGPKKGQATQLMCLFETKAHADLVKNGGRFHICYETKARNQPFGLFYKPNGADKAGSVLPLINIMSGTHRKNGYPPTDFRFDAFKNIENRIISQTPIQTSIPFTKPASTKRGTKKVMRSPTNGLHITNVVLATQVAKPAIHLVINNCKVSGTAEDVAKLLKQM